MAGLSLQQEGLKPVNLLQERNILPTTLLKPPVPNLHEEIQKLNCNPELFRCTLTNIPQTQALLNKAKLPLGLLLHPFKDLSLRPPQPPVYLFVFDVSHNAIETGYLNTVCQTLLDNLDLLPGNTRTKIGFITFDSTIHFYSLQEGLSQPQMLIVSDIEDVFIPMPENLLVNLNENKEKAFQTGTTARLDERIFTMCQVKNQPLVYLMLMTHPSLYRVDNLTDEVSICIATWSVCPVPKIGMM
ncbi:protein transport protein hypothetical protein [Limosa lapponica baueri]|uniref:Sec23/Sec24 trunk domain-containing protein n=1 Tax=Limosa lapponica baueri TaxID=1758121 RepID=A0A2I0TAY7_LIMLA|nr:protein transport protein hypothetical protein [Limosa lapponica baueri]